jgi:hypothetical protein
MARLFLIFLLFNTSNLFAQSPNITPHLLSIAFSKTIVKDKKGKIVIGRRAWYSCNDSQAYLKKDTISLVSYPKTDNNVNCCNTVAWTFYDKSKFIETDFQKCKEPTWHSATKAESYYSLKITISGTRTFLTVNNNYGKMVKYEVLDLLMSSDESTELANYELLLKRIN